MSRTSRIKNKPAAASKSLVGRAPDGANRRTANPRSELLSLQRAAGNQAVNEALKKPSSNSRAGKPMKSEMQAKMEQAFEADFTEVRIHDDANAQAKAKAVSARAFTQGQDIYLGAKAPSLESDTGRHLLAHELAHVVQQERAGSAREGSVSEPGDKFEQVADVAASRAGGGQTARVQSSGAPPGIQRDGETVSRAEVEAALTQFLERARQAQGGQSVRVTAEVRNAIEMLARTPGPMNDSGRTGPNEMMRLMRIQIWLEGRLLPGRPAELAREVAGRLAYPIDAAALESLRQMPVAPTTTTVGRVRELIKRTEPGAPERPPLPPTGPTSQERFEQGMRDLGRQTGQPQPTTIGPYSLDVLRIGRILGGLSGAVRGRRPQPPVVEAQGYQEVEQVIQQISPDALVPAEARGGPSASNFADDAREVARELSRLLDVAQQQRQNSVQLNLGPSYESVRNRGAITAEIGRIARLIRDALPHHATSVRTIIVRFGTSTIWVPLGQATPGSVNQGGP
jgi:hypothetical protein